MVRTLVERYADHLVGIDGALIHAVDREDEQAQRFCQGDDRPSTEGMVRQLAARYADSLRGDLAPVQRLEQIRVMETRKGLSKDDGRAFREAVRLTKSDRRGGLRRLVGARGGAIPRNASVLFNLGLCAESRGRAARGATTITSASSPGTRTIDYAQAGRGRESRAAGAPTPSSKRSIAA